MAIHQTGDALAAAVTRDPFLGSLSLVEKVTLFLLLQPGRMNSLAEVLRGNASSEAPLIDRVKAYGSGPQAHSRRATEIHLTEAGTAARHHMLGEIVRIVWDVTGGSVSFCCFCRATLSYQAGGPTV